MQNIAERRFLRLSQILGDKRASPPVAPIIPVSRSTWWSGIKTGRFPQPVRLGTRTTVWRSEDINALLDRR
jgi:predicted DNA-binding transcriptional regulator AlpA